jgi:hypothetical protein
MAFCIRLWLSKPDLTNERQKTLLGDSDFSTTEWCRVTMSVVGFSVISFMFFVGFKFLNIVLLSFIPKVWQSHRHASTKVLFWYFITRLITSPPMLHTKQCQMFF